MGKHTDQRDRTLCLVRILYEQTDEKHPLTTPQRIRRLEKAGLTAERKSVYRDLGAMKKRGFPVDHRRGLGCGWYMASRPWTWTPSKSPWMPWPSIPGSPRSCGDEP